MTLKNQNIRYRQLIDITMPLKLLAQLRTDRADGHIERVHLLDFGGLALLAVVVFVFVVHRMICRYSGREIVFQVGEGL